MKARIFTTGQTVGIQAVDAGEAPLPLSFKIDVKHRMPMDEFRDVGALHVPKSFRPALEELARMHGIEIVV